MDHPRIKRAGFSVSIDDFGVKYANLALLKNVDIDTLKLDKSMLINIGEQKKTCSLIGSMVQFCTETGIRFIVEGVETEEQFQIVQNLSARARRVSCLAGRCRRRNTRSCLPGYKRQ